MGVASKQPVLKDEEWQLVIELLERESRELPMEIHHSRTRGMRDDLKQRLRIVEDLMARLGE